MISTRNFRNSLEPVARILGRMGCAISTKAVERGGFYIY